VRGILGGVDDLVDRSNWVESETLLVPLFQVTTTLATSTCGWLRGDAQAGAEVSAQFSSVVTA